MAVIHLGLTDLLPDIVAKQNSNNLYIANNVAYALTAGTAAAGSTLESILKTGWNSITQTLTYSAADVPTFTATTSADLTPFISVGMKIKLTNTTVKYFIVTAITSSTITLYGGTDYALTNVVISAVYYSPHKSPFGFPLNPAKWSVIVTDTTAPSQASPVSGTWYNVGGTLSQITAPIGLWRLSYSCEHYIQMSPSASMILETGLYDVVAGAIDPSFTARSGVSGGTLLIDVIYRSKIINPTVKSSYYLDMRSQVASASSIGRNSVETPTILMAECAYL